MDENKPIFSNIPNGSIYVNNKIYILFDKNQKEIPENSIIYNNNIYIEYMNVNNNSTNNNIINQQINVNIEESNMNSKDNNNKYENKNNEKKRTNKKKAKSHDKENTTKIIIDKNEEETPEETMFKKLNKYYYNTENNNIMKYSVNRINKSTKTNKLNSVSFNCYDTYCAARAHANIIYTKYNDEKEIIEIKDFSIRIGHSIPYDKHIYVIYNEIDKDIKNNKINEEKLKTDIIYTRAYFMNLIKNSPYTQLNKLELDFINKYKIKDLTSRFNNEKKISIKNIILSAQLLLKRTNDLYQFSKNNILNLKDYNNNNIVETLTCKYYRNNIINEDLIYIILTENIKRNLSNFKPDTIFIDCTYKIIPPGLKGYKFLVIVGYSDTEDKLKLYLYSLIRHENKENFETIFNYLKIKYDFKPTYIMSDYQKGQIKAIINSFGDSKLLLCWFHALKAIKSKIPFLNSKNSSEKNLSKNLISNLKLLQ